LPFASVVVEVVELAPVRVIVTFDVADPFTVPEML
jgi:hypothetical protein